MDVDKQDELADVLREADASYLDSPKGMDHGQWLAAAVRSFMGSDEAVARACAAAIPEPEHLYVGRDEAYRSDMQRAVKIERLVFETKLRDALPAILQSPDE